MAEFEHAEKLRKLRLWHYAQALAYYEIIEYWRNVMCMYNDPGAVLYMESARQNWVLHNRFAKELNNFFAEGDSVEQDWANENDDRSGT